MLTGLTVFVGEPTAMLIDHAKTNPEPPSKAAGITIPERLEQIVLACLEKAPENRPQSALDLWQQLGEVTLETPWSVERAESWWREHSSRSPRAQQGNDERTMTLHDR
jgi:serine/threonine-protein kinase